MHGCQGCQELLLDHLYGLLDEAEGKALLDHLAGCPACQAALEKARAQQQALAAAARGHFPQVRFVAPADPTPAPAPALLAVRPVLRPRRRWVGWAAAAALLLAVAGLAVPGRRAYDRYAAARDVIERHERSVADARGRLADSQAKLGAVRQEIVDRQLRLVVTGPRTFQPGAPAEFEVQTVDLSGKPADVELSARLGRQPAEAQKKVGVEKKRSHRDADREERADGKTPAHAAEADLTVAASGPGRYRVRIPPTVRLQPGESLDMLVSARKMGSGGTSVRLSGQVRLTAPVYLTHLTTDKPMYQPGEVVHFRSLTLDRHTLQPPAEDFTVHVTVTTPAGAVQPVLSGRTALVLPDARNGPRQALGPGGQPIRGVGAGSWLIDPSLPGGEYTLTVQEQSGQFAPAQRKFLVNRYQKPRLDKKIDFNRATYGPGDEVQVRASATLPGGGPARRCPVEAAVTVDDRPYDAAGRESPERLQAQTDEDGAAVLRFRLPARIERGAAGLAVTFKDGVHESIVRPIPLVLARLDVRFFPEGGDLVAGLPNRVYFQARTPLGKPAQLRGVLLEDGRPTGVTAETLHDDAQPGVNQGNGAFTFTPRAGRSYALRIDTPTGIAAKPLPDVQPDGVVLHIDKGVFEPGEPIRVQARSTRPRPLLVGLYCRNEVLGTLTLPPGHGEAVLRPSGDAGGVCRVTVFEEIATGQTQRQLKPVAERLVYRHPRRRIDVSISPDQRRYLPGQKVRLSVATTDEGEKLRSAIVLLGVVDRSVINLADARTDRSMPAHFLLTGEVGRPDDLEFADFLLGPQAKAAPALDLLLGTQGWRRFAEQDPNQFLERLRREGENLPEGDRLRQLEEGERLLVLIGQSEPQKTDFDEERINRAAGESAEASRALRDADEEGGYRAAVATVNGYDRWLHRGRRLALPLLGALLIVLALVSLMRGVARQPALRWAALTAGCAALLLIVWRSPIDLGVPAPGARPREVAQAPLLPDVDAAQDAGEVLPENAIGGGDAAVPTAGVAPGAGPAEAGKPGASPAPMMPGGPPPPTAPRLEGKGGAGAPGAAGRAGGLPRGAATFGRGKAALPYAALPYQAAFKEAEARGGASPLAGLRKADEALRLGYGASAEPQSRFPLRADDYAPQRMARRFRNADKLGKDRSLAAAGPLVVREYAHVHQPASAGVRDDFTETVYWHPVLVLPDGKADVSFDLCDSVTTFEVTAYAHTLDGRLGSAVKRIESRLPFSLAPKVPVEVTAGDRVDLPVVVSNTTAEPHAVELTLASHEGLDQLPGSGAGSLSLAPQGRARRLFSLRPAVHTGRARVEFRGSAGPYADVVRESFSVVPDGFPSRGASSDLLEGSATHRVTLPRWLPGTLACEVEVYPSTLADLQKGLDGLLAEPHGCFEQASTTNYPNVLILDYLRSADRPDPALERRVRDLLDRGYRKLTSYECQEPGGAGRRGYEWFGGTAPPHEALTAYGLLQFRDMARVHPVDAAMLDRTRSYLLAQRDGEGGFKRNPRAVDSFGRAPQAITNAYIVWALTESGRDEDLTRELDALASQARTADDAYFLSLVAIGLANRGRGPEAERLLRKVAGQQKEDGRVEASRTSVTGSGGRDLTIETTALALLGWLKANPQGFDGAVRKAVRWVGRQRGGAGGFGSTQSTILALKALVAHARANKRTPEAGELRLFVGDDRVAELRFPAGVDKPLRLTVPDPEKKLVAGLNKLRVEITGARNHFPHTLSWTCRTTTPPSADKAPVRLETRLARKELTEGEGVRLSVRVENRSGRGQGMAVAVVGLPGGLIVPEDLKQLRGHCRVPADGSRPLLGAFEVRGRELTLYWRDLAPGQAVEVPIDLIARVPGAYRGPASRAYLYYDADLRHWVEPLSVTIAAGR